MPTPSLPPTAQRGFTAVPRAVFDRLLCLDLTKRELLVVLLIIRLTYGVRNVAWMTLRQADLAAVGIGANHAKATLALLLRRGIIAYDHDRNAYQVARGVGHDIGSDETEAMRAGHLARLVAEQLARPTQAERSLTETGCQMLPKREEGTSQNGNLPSRVPWQFCLSRKGFVRASDLAKDRERQI
jgi:hypothetical protein